MSMDDLTQPLTLNGEGPTKPQSRVVVPPHHDEDEEEQRTSVTMAWKDLSYEVVMPKTKDIRKILNGVSGHVGSGQMLAILGPSGAGKTTMLDILAQRQKGGKVAGELTMNGHPVEQGVFRRVSAYVQQEDIMHGYLTVEETISYAARLRTDSTHDRAALERRVLKVMRMLGIDHVRNTKIGSEVVRGVSGGEKKRCAIGVELVTAPSLLFLDEPTTGLDTFTALHLLYLLKKLTTLGTTVIFSIHQPRSSIFRLFDLVLLLNGHGEQAYFGPAQEAEKFLLQDAGLHQEHPDNPADFLLDSVAVVRAAENLNREDFPFLPPPTQASDIAAAFRATKLDGVNDHIDSIVRTYEGDSGLPMALKTPYLRPVYQQIWVVACRSLVNKLRDPIATGLAVVVAIFFALLVGSIYFQIKSNQAGITDRLGVLFFLTMNTAFSSLGSLAVFLFDRSIYVREHRNGMYRPSAYYLGKILQDVPMTLAVTALFDVIAYYMVGLQPSFERFGWFLLISLLVVLNSYSLCMFLSNLAKNYQVANLLAPVFLVLYLLPSGFLINLDSLPIYWRWIKYISFFRFGFEAVVVNEFDGLTFTCTELENATGTCCTDGLQCVDLKLGFEAGSFKLNVLWTGVSALVYFILGYIALRFLRSNEGK